MPSSNPKARQSDFHGNPNNLFAHGGESSTTEWESDEQSGCSLIFGLQKHRAIQLNLEIRVLMLS